MAGFGGRINEGDIRRATEYPASAAASSGGTPAVAGAPAGRALGRSAELEALARPAVSRSFRDSTAGPSRRAAVPARAAAREAPADPSDVLEEALQHVDVWGDLMRAEQEREETLGPGHELLGHDQAVRSALSILGFIQKALRALATLTTQGNVPADYDGDQLDGDLSHLLATAAESGVCARQAMLNEIWDQSQGDMAERSATGAEPAAASEGDTAPPVEEQDEAGPMFPSSDGQAAPSAWAQLQQNPEKLRGWLRELDQFGAAMDEVRRRYKAPGTSQKARSILKVIQSDVIYNQSRCCTARQTLLGIIAAASANRFAKLAGEMGLPELAARVDELHVAWRYREEAVTAAIGALSMHGAKAEPADRATLQALAEHNAVLGGYAERLESVGLSLCMDAAARIDMNDASGLWQSMMDAAHAIGDYKKSLHALSEAARAVGATLGSVPSARMPTSSPNPTPKAGPARPSRSARRKATERFAGPSVPAPAPAPATAPSDTRTKEQKKADAILKRFPVDYETAKRFGGDFLAIARSLGENTRTIEHVLNDPKSDAVRTADICRVSVKHWFGEMDRVHGAKASLRPNDDRIGPLTNRLDALKLIDDHLNGLEADMLKRDRHPRASHLSRLLEGGQLRLVDVPVKLASEGDRGELGTLFEIRIPFKPLTNGQPVAPWFVHLHTRQLVAPQALAKLAFSAFTAVHVKTEREKNLGPRWEAVMRALGYTDTKVHRAAIGSDLLSKLFAELRRSRAQVPQLNMRNR